jgi:predicted TIM-barrel fold metal-dependent hydrolase
VITDAQLHLWPPAPPGSDYPDYAHGTAFTADQALSMMDAGGVDRAVLVPPSWSGDDNAYCLAAVRDHPDRFTSLGRVSLEPQRTPDELADWYGGQGVRGLRLTFARGAAARWLAEGRADWLWPAAAAAGIPVFVYAPGQTDALAGIAAAAPKLRLVVDHLAFDIDLRDDELDVPLDRVCALAAYPNVAVKATALPSYTAESYPFAALGRRLRRVLGVFGRRRVFWGSDATRLSVPYDQCVRFPATLDLPPEDHDWLMHRGISEWIGWG